ncbi:MAG TPA: hypothetical protein VM658_08335 [bacterium]|nr:hypothetical protein [bacterium]
MGRKAVMGMAMALIVSWPVMGRADTLSTMGASSRGTAMGGAMIAIADGWEAAYYNSSALALSRNSSSIQYSQISGSLYANKNDELADGSMVKVGINHRFLRDRIGVGMLIGLGGSGGSDLSSLFDINKLLGGGGPPNWSWQNYKDSMPLLLSVGFGFRITDWLSVGITAYEKPLMVSTGNMAFLIVDPIVKATLGLDSGKIYSNLHGFGFSAGGDPRADFVTGFNVTFRPIKYLSLGYSYTPETWARYKIRAELPGGQGGLLADDWFFLIDMKVPGHVETTVYGGAANLPIPWNDGWLTLAYSRELQNWDGFFPSTVTYDWDATTRWNPESFANKLPRDPGLEDVAFDRFGFEYKGDASPLLFWKLKKLSNPRFAVRGGYYHWNSPQPDANYTWQVAMIDSDADVYSFGLGFGYDRVKKAGTGGGAPPRVEIDLHFQQTNLEDRDYRMLPNEYGSVPLENYLVKTSGGISQVGIQVTWWQ